MGASFPVCDNQMIAAAAAGRKTRGHLQAHRCEEKINCQSIA
jgi:hypothetical protein